MVNRIIVYIALIVFLMPVISDGQQKESSIFRIIGSDISESLNDGSALFTSPLHWKEKDGITLGALFVTTAAVYLKDESIRANSFKQRSEMNDEISDAAKLYGEIAAPVIIGGGIYTAGLFSKNEYIRVTGRMVFESVLYSGIVTNVFKTAIGRSRPQKEEGSQFYRLLSFNTGNTSMPSGHSTVAFAVSSVLANRINNTFASIGLYTLAGITALSRVYHDEHWASDVLLGSAIGYFIGDFISSKRNSTTGSRGNITIYPGAGSLNLHVCL